MTKKMNWINLICRSYLSEQFLPYLTFFDLLNIRLAFCCSTLNVHFTINDKDHQIFEFDCINSYNIRIIGSIRKYGSNETFIEAITHAHSFAIRFLVEHGFDLETPIFSGSHFDARTKISSLAWTIKENRLKTAKLLIKLGADVNNSDTKGQPTLFYGRSKKVIMLLYKAGADINARGINRYTALMNAVNADDKKRVKILLKLGANPNYRNWAGETALHLATDHSTVKIMKLLLKFGADRMIKSNEGFTPCVREITGKIAAEKRKLLETTCNF